MEDYVNPNPEQPASGQSVPEQPASERPIPQPPRMAPVPPAYCPPVKTVPEAGKWEFLFAGMTVLCSVLMCNFILYGGFHLGFALAAIGLVLCSWGYLRAKGYRLDWYSGSLLGMSLIIAAGFGRSADGSVKFIMLLFLFVGVNLSLCLAAKQNRRDPGRAASLLDAPRALFRLGFGGMGGSARGLVTGLRNSGSAGRKTGSVMLGLVIAVPILLIMVPLLMNADAAFEGLLDLLPEIELGEYLTSGLWGILLGWVLYSRGVGLHHSPRIQREKVRSSGLNALTVSTILTAVCALYAVYLISQLAYLAGGFSGILPEEFTMAEYARRGFFEMAWLCVINLLLICGSIALVRKEPAAPLYARLCCLFIGTVTIFLVATASAKMFMYIGSYGLTRLRVLTEVIMLWLALTTVIVCLWLFVTKLPYMKIVVLAAMVMGALVFWIDVDTVVARYNVNAYRSGKLETVDMAHLNSLGYSATPYLYQLIDDPDPEVSLRARNILRRSDFTVEDFREWNWDYARAADILQKFHEEEDQSILTFLSEQVGLDLSGCTLQKNWSYRPFMLNGQQFMRLELSEELRDAVSIHLQDSGWVELPLHVHLKRAVFGLGAVEPLFTAFDAFDASANAGWYSFTDLHPEAEDPSDPSLLYSREYAAFQLMWYDSANNILYFFRLDQSMTPAGE